MTFTAQSSSPIATQSTSFSFATQHSIASYATEQLSEMSDAELFRRCQKYGEQTRYWRQKFCGLLPEVNQRRLYERKGFNSIFEFAAKLAGLSREQVQRVLNLEQKFQAMPTLHTMLVNGEVSMNKLAKIASMATPENERELVERVHLLSTRVLEVLVRDEKCAGQVFDNQNGLFKGKYEGESVHVNRKMPSISLDVKMMALIPKFSEELKIKLLELDEKGLSVNEILLELLKKREEELDNEKEKLSREQEMLRSYEAGRETTMQGKAGSGQMMKKPSRYIPAKIRHHLKQEYGTKCAKPACHKAAESIHHTARWSLSHNHDPKYLAPLCKAHHEVAHMVDVKVQEYRMARRW